MRSDQPFSALAHIPIGLSFCHLRTERPATAAHSMRESLRVLEKGGLNIVGEVLRGQGTFYEMQHYPANDVYDRDSHAQYYYHAHRGSQLEHGHFHLFMRRAGMPPNTLPAKQSYSRTLWPSDNDAIAHLIAISMDKKGLPLGLFACNRWVTGETWYAADQVIGMLDAFEIDHAYPSWPTNLWLSSVVKVYRTEIEALLRHRDQIVTAWQQRFPDKDALEDRELEITGYLPITL